MFVCLSVCLCVFLYVCLSDWLTDSACLCFCYVYIIISVFSCFFVLDNYVLVFLPVFLCLPLSLSICLSISTNACSIIVHFLSLPTPFQQRMVFNVCLIFHKIPYFNEPTCLCWTLFVPWCLLLVWIKHCAATVNDVTRLLPLPRTVM